MYGVGLYTSLMIIAELGEINRFRSAKQVGGYAGLTAKVNQSGGHCYYGSITSTRRPLAALDLDGGGHSDRSSGRGT